MHNGIYEIIDTTADRYVISNNLSKETVFVFKSLLVNIIDGKTDYVIENIYLNLYEIFLKNLLKEKNNTNINIKIINLLNKLLNQDGTYKILEKLHIDISLFLSLIIKWELIDADSLKIENLNLYILKIAEVLTMSLRKNKNEKFNIFLKDNNIPERLFGDFEDEYKKYL